MQRKFSVNDNYFNRIDSHEKAYFLGWMITDGCVTIRHVSPKCWHYEMSLGVTEKDQNVLEQFLKALKSNYKIFQHENNHKKIFPRGLFCSVKRSVRIRITSKKLVEALAKYGVVPRKTNCSFFPTKVPKKYWPGLIAGIISGGGSVFFKKHRAHGRQLLSVIYGTPILLKGVMKALKQVGIIKDTKKVYKQYKDGIDTFGFVSFNQSETFRLHFWMTKSKVRILERKHIKIEEQIEYLKTLQPDYGHKKVVVHDTKQKKRHEFRSQRLAAKFLNVSEYVVSKELCGITHSLKLKGFYLKRVA